MLQVSLLHLLPLMIFGLHGRLRSSGEPQFLPPLRRPHCTLSRLRAEEYDRPVTQSTATPEPTVLSRLGSSAHLNWILTVFTGLACYLGALPGLVRTVIPVPRGDHLPSWGSPVFLPLRLTEGTYHADWTVPRQDVNSPFSPRVCHLDRGVCSHASSGPARVRRRLFGSCLGDPIPLANPPRYESFNFTWDADAASNELAAIFILLPGLPEAPDVPELFDAIGLEAAEELDDMR